jgi:hypothetical protein
MWWGEMWWISDLSKRGFGGYIYPAGASLAPDSVPSTVIFQAISTHAHLALQINIQFHFE